MGKNAQQRRARKLLARFQRMPAPPTSWIKSQLVEQQRAELDEDKQIPNRAARRRARFRPHQETK